MQINELKKVTMCFPSQQNWQRFFSDGLHFSSEGSKFLFNLLWPIIDELTDKLPMLMPDWSVVAAQPVNSLPEILSKPGKL